MKADGRCTSTISLKSYAQCMLTHPMHAEMLISTKIMLKRTCFIHLSKSLNLLHIHSIEIETLLDIEESNDNMESTHAITI